MLNTQIFIDRATKIYEETLRMAGFNVISIWEDDWIKHKRKRR